MTPFVKFENSCRSDHSPVVLYCKINNLKRGRGFWKFNNSLLTDKDYVNIVKKTINDVKIQYSCPVYNADNVLNIDNDTIQFTIKDQTFMDILLTDIRGKTISYATFKKQKIRVKESALEKDITSIEQNVINYSTEELTKKQS